MPHRAELNIAVLHQPDYTVEMAAHHTYGATPVMGSCECEVPSLRRGGGGAAKARSLLRVRAPPPGMMELPTLAKKKCDTCVTRVPRYTSNDSMGGCRRRDAATTYAEQGPTLSADTSTAGRSTLPGRPRHPEAFLGGGAW